MNQDIATAPEREAGSSMHVLGSEGFHEFIRYAVASGIALLCDVGALTILTSVFDVSYLVSGAIAFIIGLIVIYILSTHWVFTELPRMNAWRAFAVFALIGIVGLGINELVLWVLTGWFGLFYLSSKAASIVLVFAWNFAARKRLLFSA